MTGTGRTARGCKADHHIALPALRSLPLVGYLCDIARSGQKVEVTARQQAGAHLPSVGRLIKVHPRQDSRRL